jgi:hypothetical protein
MINKTAFVRCAVAAISVPATLLAVALGSTAPASADTPFGTPHELVQHSSDGQLQWTVPAGTTSVHLQLVGGSGADGHSGAGSSGGRGGHGGIVDETIAVKPGQTLDLLAGSAASPGGAETWFGDADGGKGGLADSNGNGGSGGAATWVTLDGQVIGIAGGGGGGGGGGAIYTYAGGNGGDAGHAGSDGSGYGAGSGASGNLAGAANVQHGEAASDAPPVSYAGGGGGGGAGWDGAGLGGGRAGGSGTYGGGGGGGAAGGLSWGADKNTSYSTRSASGDGLVVLDWTVASDTASKLNAPASAPQGRPVTLTDTITPAISGGPAVTGEVRFEMEDINTYAKTVIGTAKVVDGVATLTTSSLPPGQYQGIHAIYSGDDNYQGSTSDFVYPNITAPIKTVSLSPTSLSFGNVPLKSLRTKDVQVTNTGSVDWSWSSASTDNADVNMPKTTCGTLKPGDSCTVTISYQPHSLGAVTAHISFDTTFGTLTIPVTGTGVTPAPTVTKVNPNSGSHHGGTRVTITGTNFVNVSSITLGGKKLTAVSCSSATSCQATTPAGTVGAHDVRVITATGTSPTTTADRFTYK